MVLSQNPYFYPPSWIKQPLRRRTWHLKVGLEVWLASPLECARGGPGPGLVTPPVLCPGREESAVDWTALRARDEYGIFPIEKKNMAVEPTSIARTVSSIPWTKQPTIHIQLECKSPYYLSIFAYFKLPQIIIVILEEKKNG